MNDLGQALTRLRRRPGRTLSAAVSLGVGIAAATASFSAVQTVLLRPLPVERQDQVSVFWHQNPVRGFTHVPFGSRAFEVASEGASLLASVAGVETAGARPVAVEGPRGAYEVNHVKVAGDFFGTLGARPALGRLLEGRDDESGVEPAAVLSHGAWMRLHGGDADVVGSTVRYGGRPFTVVGVAPEGLDIPQGTDLWLTLRGAYPSWGDEEPVGVELDIVARLAPGARPELARAELAELLGADPDLAPVYADLVPVSMTLPDHLFGSMRPVLTTLLAAALVLLLAAVANTVLLLLAGGARITREMAVRRALGATKGRVLRQTMWDAGLVAGMGVVLGVALAWLAVEALVPLAPTELPRLDEVRVDPTSVAFAAGLTVLAGVVAGGLAGVVLGRPHLAAALGSTRGSGHPGGGLRRAVASLQVALAVVAAVGAGLLIRSVDHLRRLDLGFDHESLSVVSLTHSYALFEVPPSYIQALEDVSRSLTGLPGIEAAAPTLNPPLTLNGGIDVVVGLEGQTDAEFQASPYMSFEAVLPGYFAALGVPTVRGRTFEPGDGTGGAPVVVVSEAAARTLWPGGDPLGQQINLRFPAHEETWWAVIGVVADTRYRDLLDPRASVYFPLARMAAIPPSRLLVRVGPGGPRSVRAQVDEAFASVDPGVTVIREERMDDVLARPAARPRFAAGVLVAFAVTTLLLAGFGVYGVFATLVQERTREMGLRRALGAPPGSVERVVLGGVLRLAVVGALGGVLVSVWASRWADSLLHGVGATDPATFAVVTLGALGVALLAGVVPARRAGGTDPAISLRAD